MNFILIAVLVLGAIGLIAALVLYVCSDQSGEALPGGVK